MCALFCITIALINLFDLNGKTFSTVTSYFCECEVFLQSGRAGHESSRCATGSNGLNLHAELNVNAEYVDFQFASRWVEEYHLLSVH